jgi:glycosyltransferase involved in cell wall biosynthesis
MRDKCTILVIGPNAKGGISSVINSYESYGLFDGNIIRLASYRGGNIVKRLVVFAMSLIRYFWILFTNKNVKIIHIHSATDGSFVRKYIVFKIAKMFEKKVIFHIHCAVFDKFYNNSSTFVKNRVKEVLDNSNVIIVLSDYWKNVVSQISTNKNIKILYNPCMVKEFEKITTEKINVLFMGRVGKRKGVYDIIEAAKLITNPNIEINLYGDGETPEFQKLIQENNLQNIIKLKGWVSSDTKDTAFKSSDIYILPSYEEGLPMSVLEAMAYGLPIISTPVGGIPDAVEDCVNGFLVQPGNYKALVEKINLLTNDKELNHKMGQESFKKAKEKFDINVIIKQLKEIYDELVK